MLFRHDVNTLKCNSMKKYILLILILFWAFQGLDAKKIRTFLWYTTFNSPQDGPFVETYLSIAANSLNYVQLENGKYQGKLEITIVFKQDDKVAKFSKYDLESPVVDDTSDINLNFIDQQRFALPNGSYDFEISMRDLIGDGKEYSYVQPLNISFPDNKITFSGIEMVDTYTKTESDNILSKSGYDLVPYVSNFFPENKSQIVFYTELYNTKKVLGNDGMFLLRYYIEAFETGSVVSNLQKTKRKEAEKVIPLLARFDITDLPSGNYKLVIEVINRENELITANEVFFQRSNPNIQFDLNDIAAVDIAGSFVSDMESYDTLKEYILSTSPIATDIEKQFVNKQLPGADLKMMQQFFYNFWLTRNAADPASEWYDYKEEVEKVNNDYSTQVRKGYDTDRGRIYLKYGPPNIISESYTEPSTYPYEIWHYYSLGDNQRDKKFVFYTLNIVTNNFELLHSDAIGELSNYRWQIDLNRRIYDPNNLDVTSPADSWGSHADKYFRNPF